MTGRWKWVLPALVPALFGAALWALSRQLKEYHLPQIREAVQALPGTRIALAAALTAASYGLLSLYDWLGLKYARRRLAYPRVALTSFVAYVCSYNIGFSVLGGAAVRYRLYTSWGLSAEEIGKVVLFAASGFWLGMATVGGVVFLVTDLPLALTGAAAPWLRLVGVVLLVAVAAYLIACSRSGQGLQIGGWQVNWPPWRLALGQVAVAVVDVTLAGAVLYALLPGGNVNFLTFLGAYVGATTIGLVSHVPGGLGVFEAVMLATLPTGTPQPQLVAMLVVFRALYYLLPFSLGLLLLTAETVHRHRVRLAGVAGLVVKGVSQVTPRVMTFAAFLAGVILLASGATPGVGTRLSWLNQFLPLGVLDVSHFLASVAGAGLLFLARGLQLRLNAAWGITLAVLLAGAMLSLAKGGDFEEAIALAATAAALWVSRSNFRRKSSLWDQRFSPAWLAAIALVLIGTTWLGFFSHKHVEYQRELWWAFGLDADAPRFLRASVGVAGVVMVIGLARLLRPARQRPTVATPDDLAAALAVAAAAPESDANLVALGDKAVLLSETRRSFIMYNGSGRNWVALGDPVGDPEEREELVWEFRELCDAAGARTVFYQVSGECLPLYVDLGLSLFKLGEEARVSLTDFSLQGGHWKGMRKTRSRLESDGCEFGIWEPEEVGRRLNELREVSDAWLTGKNTREKGFSLGSFRPDYLQRFPAAVVTQAGRVAAFATLWRSGGKEELSVDLMRERLDAPPGVMDFLFIRLMLDGAEDGYRWFNLGMAPFSGIERHPLAPLWNRIGALLFRHGEHFYNFQGLRRYKDKFNPVWRPRYLASPGGLTLPRVLADVASLVSGGLSGIIRK